jgi:glycosyltransferase involved in cell wall biosynthesis
MENIEKRPLLPTERKLRVLTFTTLYPGASRPNHGVFVENRLRELVSTGRVEAKVIAPVPWFPVDLSAFGDYAKFAQMPKREVRYGLEITHPRYPLIPKLGMSTAPASLFAAALPILRNYKRQWNFDLIDAHYFYPDGVAASWLGRALNKPVVITARGTDINLIPRHLLPRRMILDAARRAAGIVAVSRALKDEMVSIGVNENRIEVLRNGVALEMFRPVDRDAIRSALGVTGRVLLSVGHLIERKGHDIVISALPHLTGYTLLIAGEGPEEPRLKSLVSNLKVEDRVRFLGSIPHEKLHEIYNAADALILASSREGWPNVLLEAMACGTPVVASPVWGNPEVVASSDAGVLMAARTPEDLAEAVNALFQDAPDRAATRAFAEKFSWNETSAGQIRLFEKILKTSRNAAQV